MEDSFKIKIGKIEETDVPKLIQEQFVKMKDYKKNVESAKAKAEEAATKAKQASEKKVGFLKMKSSIEDLQTNQIAISEATLENAEAQEKSFEYQRLLSDVTKYLFGLGVTNIAVNRCVVKELEMRLKDASNQEIDEMARNELCEVVRQLKAQEDLLQKQLELSGKVKEHDSKLIIQEDKDSQHEVLINDILKENVQLKERINKLEAKSNRRNKMLIICICLSTLVSLATLGLVLWFIFK